MSKSSSSFWIPGSLLHVAHSQRHYVSTNYTHVARDVAAHGVNVIAQLVAKRSVEGRAEFSLGSNPDVTLDLLEHLAPQRRQGREVVVIGEVHRQMPFMFGPAAVAADTFDYLVEHPRYDYDLFAPPNQRCTPPITQSACMRRGWCAMAAPCSSGSANWAMPWCTGCSCAISRTSNSATFCRSFKAAERFGATLDAIGGDAPFESGLYACTEMFVDGFLDLYRRESCAGASTTMRAFRRC